MISTYIFCTEDVSETPIAFLDEIDSILNGFKNDYVFGCKTSKDSEIFGDKYEKFIDENSRMSLEEFFDICNNIRNQSGYIGEDEFVVLLTTKRNSKNWFSATDGKNIYINVSELEKYSNNQTKYPITFQIIENIFQAQCGIFYSNFNQLNVLHKKSQSCINDICENKSNIIIKLKNASICDSCKDYAKSKGLTEENLESLESILKHIKNIAITRLPKKTKQGHAIKVDKKGNITVHDELIEMEELLKAFYIFFLIYDQGFKKEELENHVNEIAILYDKIKDRYKESQKLSDEKIKRITNIVTKNKDNGFVASFNRKLTEINRCLEKQVNPEFIEEFKILRGEDGRYRVKISSSRIHVAKELKSL